MHFDVLKPTHISNANAKMQVIPNG